MKLTARLLVGLLASTALPTLAHAGEVSGVVSDETGTRALQSATVRIPELNREALTDRGGHYIFGDVPAGTYSVEAEYVGAKPQAQTVAVDATGKVTSNFALAGVGGADILVVGQAANQASALSRQKAADGVVSVLTRDAVGQFPDQNIAESLRRLPGVNILNDQGEGRFVSVRGLDPELNAASINGVRLPAPESDVRSVALDVISSDTIESIEVKKSFTPDMDGDFIGASVEVKTTSAFDSKKNRYSVSAEGSWNDYSGKVTPKAAFDFTQKLGDNSGIAGSVSYYKRKFETDNVEADGWNTDDRDNAWVETVEYRDYDVERTRINAALSFDWRASDTTKAYVRGNWSQFDDQEYRRRTTLDFGDFEDGPTRSTPTGASFASSDERITVVRDLKDRFERQRIRSVAVGSDTDTGTWKFNWQASYAKSSEKEDFSLDPNAFRARFTSGVALDMDYSGQYFPTYTVTSGVATFNDPAKYGFNKLELTTLSDSQDEEYAVKADLARTFAGDRGDLTVQVGGKGRWRDKSYDYDQSYYQLAKGVSYTLADVLGSQTYRLLDMGPVASKSGSADYFLANPGRFVVNKYESDLASIQSDYAVKEDIAAGYGLVRWDSATLRVIAGVRMERTHNVLDGNLVTNNEDDEEVTVTPRRYKRNYTNWLPSVTLRWSPRGDIVARLAGYKTVVRPKLSQLAPRFTVNQDNEAEFGNPDLKPYQAWNLDAGFEYYFSGNGAFSVGAFYKSIKDYTVVRSFDDTTVDGIEYDRVTQPVNGGKAEVAGVEASFSQAFTMLPSPFDGLLTQLNYTYTYSRATVFDEDGLARRIALPSASKNTFNVVLGYEKGPISLRAAGTFRDKYLDEIGSAADSDRIIQQHFQLDLSAKYKLTDNVRLFADWVNVNNAKYFAYQDFGGAKRLLQYEEYGPTVKFGARVTF